MDAEAADTDREVVASASPGGHSTGTAAADASRQLFGRGSLYTVVLAVQAGTAFVVIPIVTRLLPPAQYGEVAAGLVVYMIVGILGSAGLPDAVTKVYFQDRGKILARNLIAMATLLPLAVGLVAELTGPWWAVLLDMPYGGVLRLAVWGGALQALMMLSQALLRAEDRALAFVVVAVIGNIVGQGIGVGLTSLHARTPVDYMAGLVIGVAVAVAVGAAVCFRGWRPSWNSRQLALGIRVGAPLIPHSLAMFLLASADRVVITAVLGLAAAGRYQVAYGLGNLGVAVMTGLNQAWLPLLLGLSGAARWQAWAHTSRQVHLFAAMMAAGTALLSPLLLVILVPASYGRTELVAVSSVVALSVVPSATISTFFPALLQAGRTGSMAISAPLAVVLNTGLNLALVPLLGILGAAVATLVAYVAMSGFVYLMARRHAQVPAMRVGVLRAYALAVPLAALGAAASSGGGGAVARAAGLLVIAAFFGRFLLAFRPRTA